MGRSMFFSLFFLTLFCQIIYSIHGKCLDDQRSKLLRFREGLLFDPEYASKLVSWNKTMDWDCCKWGGVGCDNVGHVISLDIADQSISVLNQNWKSLFYLQHLQYLNLALNSFDVRFPVELYNLTGLRYLNFSDSGFTGRIPAGLSKMSSLVTLDISSSDMEGMLEINIPGGLEPFFRNLTELKEVHMDNTNISAQGRSWCDAFSSLSKLQVLSLSGCGLSGPFSSSLSNLTSLTVLKLDSNNFSTHVPDFLANFSNLITLSLSDCDIHGQFPEQIFQMPTLEIIDFSLNRFLKGSLPKFWRFQSLKEMRLLGTNFSGSLPNSIGDLKALSTLDLSSCNFSGAIPTSLGSLFELVYLDLSANIFNGSIPNTLGNLSELVYLDLSRNRFNGSIPSFQKSKKLAQIHLYYNALAGHISSAHFEGLADLEYVRLNNNFLSGSLPSSLFALPSLQTLIVSNNQFEDFDQEYRVIDVSSSLLNLLDLSHNHFQGFIPKFIFDLQQITFLDLSFNSFTGNVSFDFLFSRLQNLDTLGLSHNNLSIDASCNSTCLSSFAQLEKLGLASCNLKMFPHLLMNQTSLMALDLSSNFITGEIPNWLWNNASNLQTLTLSFNSLDGFQKPYSLSPHLARLDLHANILKGELPLPSPGIRYLDYSNNSFNTPFPPNFGDYITKIVYLSLSNNHIEGYIPESICNATSLQILDLSHNFLGGGIPTCLFPKMGDLKVLDLGRNELQGPIPDSMPENNMLRTLDLSQNTLKGKIPNSLSNCKSLQALNVEDNYLEGRFPCKLIANQPKLRILILRLNRFHGDISCHWNNTDESLSSLQIMDIAYNNFSGFLPPQLFLNCRGMMIEYVGTKTSEPLQYKDSEYSDSSEPVMVYYPNSVSLIIKGEEQELDKILTIYTILDFSCNNFQGVIPDEIGGLTALYLLNLSHNSLTGTVPTSVGKLAKLNALDLSMNELTGEIPINLEDLNSLGFLNLSYNQLVGKIPDGIHFQTFSESSFLGNKGLCGKPLNIRCINGSSASPSPVSPNTFKNDEIDWKYISAAMGFSVGLGIILLLNCFNPRFNALIVLFLSRVLGLHVQERLSSNSF